MHERRRYRTEGREEKRNIRMNKGSRETDDGGNRGRKEEETKESVRQKKL
jgi:hypothetical protein